MCRARHADEQNSSGRVITKWCEFYERGNCQRGKFCTFAHSESDFGAKWVDRTAGDTKLVLCKFWKDGHISAALHSCKLYTFVRDLSVCWSIS